MAWLTGYTSRLQIPVNGTNDGAQALYQLIVKLYSGAGTNSIDNTKDPAEATIYLGSRGLSFPDDIRFTKSDGETLIDCWQEAGSGTNPAIYFAEYTDIPSGSGNSANFYIYTGKASDTNASSVVNTFIKGDDVERGSDEDAIGGDWVTVTNVYIDTGQKFGGTRGARIDGVTGTTPTCRTTVVPSFNKAIRFRLYKETLATITMQHSDGVERLQPRIEADEDVVYYDGSVYQDTGLNALADAWNLIEITNIDFSANTFKIWVNGVSVNCTIFTISGYTNAFAFTGTPTNDYDSWFDDFIVRNWTANQPTYGTLGSWEDGWSGEFSGVAVAEFGGVTPAEIDGV